MKKPTQQTDEPRFYEYTQDEDYYREYLDGTLEPAPRRRGKAESPIIEPIGSNLAIEFLERSAEALVGSWTVRIVMVAALCAVGVRLFTPPKADSSAAIVEVNEALAAEMLPFIQAVDATLEEGDRPSLVEDLITAGAPELALQAHVSAYRSAESVPEKMDAAIRLVELYNEQGVAISGANGKRAAVKERRVRARISTLRKKRQSYDDAVARWQDVMPELDASATMSGALSQSWPNYQPSTYQAGNAGIEVPVVQDLRGIHRR